MRYFEEIDNLNKSKNHAVTYPNYNPQFLSGKDKKRRAKDKKKYGYSSSETWSLDFTSAIWLYEHIRMLVEVGGQIVDFEAEHNWTETEEKVFKELEIAPTNDKEAFEQICEYLALVLEKDSIDIEGYAENLRKAFTLWAVVAPRAWW